MRGLAGFIISISVSISVSILVIATAGCRTAPVPADFLVRMQEAFEMPESVGAFRLAEADISGTSATFRYEQVEGPARAWVIRFPVDEREQRPETFLDLDPLLAEIERGRPEFRIERQTQLVEPDRRDVTGGVAEFTFRDGDAPWCGRLSVDLSTWRRGLWVSVLEVVYPEDERPGDLDRLILELTP
ncbi:MAG: hypothetical protein JXP34_17555 [Planctomycetes bacterium]|nr:hypothetical protein [Planctomycetota bacterium]